MSQVTMESTAFSRARKAWRVLALALKDLRKAERSPKCTVSMSTWLHKNKRGRCTVCLAGSVMRYELSPKYLAKHTRALALYPDDYAECDGHITEKLDFLSELRNLSPLGVEGALWDYCQVTRNPGATNQKLAQVRVYLETTPGLPNQHISYVDGDSLYDENPTAWWKGMRGLVKLLQKLNL